MTKPVNNYTAATLAATRCAATRGVVLGLAAPFLGVGVGSSSQGTGGVELLLVAPEVEKDNQEREGGGE